MKCLLPEYWRNFGSDGKLFEALSKVLIEYEYNQKDFYIVGGPGDGGVDVCKNIPLLDGYQNQIWAQCKFYNRTLSFNDISYTLLMAYLKNTNQILIFSYSKVSETLLDNLNEYIARTAKDVILYADDDLERLIMKHQERLSLEHREFFPCFPRQCSFSSDPFDVDYQIYIDGIRITQRETTISINSICELVITITNRTSDSREINLTYIRNCAANNFRFLEGKTDCTFLVQADHSVAFKTNIQLKTSVNRSSLPCFLLRSDGETITIKTGKKVRCRWLADTTLIGRQYYDALEKINLGIQYPHFHLVYICGKSGVGKSRLLKEARIQSIQSGKRMVYIDPEKKTLSCKRFVELLCSKMTMLPVIHKKITFLSDTDDITMEYAARILYDESFDVVKEWENAAKFFTYLMINGKYILSLDNIQHFDRLSLQIVEYIISFLINSSCESTILLGINTDYIYKKSYFDEFFCKLRYSSGNSPEYYTEISVEGFDPCDAELYIRECLSYHTNDANVTRIDYENAVEKIARHCGNNPFFIQQYLLYLQQKGIIKRSRNTLYYFSDVSCFLKSFSEIPQSIDVLISEREKIFLEQRTDAFDLAYRQLVYLINLTKSLPEEIFYAVLGDNALLNELLDMGFLSIVEACVVPIHSYYALFYEKNYPIASVPHSLLEKFVTVMKENNAHRELLLPYYWAKFQLGRSDYLDLQMVAAQINSWNFDCASFSFCLKSVSIAAEKYAEQMGVIGYLNLYKNLCTKTYETLGINESAYYYDNFFTSFLAKSNQYVDLVNPALSIITNGLIHLVNMEKYQKCLRYMDDIVTASAQFRSEDQLKIHYRINSCKIMIFNRKNLVDDAIILANENLDILEAEGIDPMFKRRLIYSAKRSIGNTYFYSTKAYENRAKIVDSWSDSFQCFIQENGLDVLCGYSDQPKVAAFAKGLAADMIALREPEAETKACFFKNAFNQMNMLYYEMQIRLLMAIYLTWKWSNDFSYSVHLAEIEQYIEQTIDIAAIYGRQLTTINAFHLRAVVSFLAGNYELALDNYCITADLLTKYLKTKEDYSRWDYFWVDLARAWKKSNLRQTPEVVGRCHTHAQETIRKICSMSEQDFETYEESYVPMTALSDKNLSVNFPKI